MKKEANYLHSTVATLTLRPTLFVKDYYFLLNNAAPVLVKRIRGLAKINDFSAFDAFDAAGLPVAAFTRIEPLHSKFAFHSAEVQLKIFALTLIVDGIDDARLREAISVGHLDKQIVVGIHIEQRKFNQFINSYADVFGHGFRDAIIIDFLIVVMIFIFLEIPLVTAATTKVPRPHLFDTALVVIGHGAMNFVTGDDKWLTRGRRLLPPFLDELVDPLVSKS